MVVVEEKTMSGATFLILCVVSVISTSKASSQVFSNTGGITNLATLSTGPFAVRTIETPSVANTNLGRYALRQRQTEFARTTVHGGVPSPSLFQTADGRVFALSNGRNSHQFAPGQIFQSADGRFFTIAAINTTPSQQSSLTQQSSSSSTSSISSNRPLSIPQAANSANQIIDARVNVPSTRNRLPKSSVSFRPTPASTTTISSPTVELTTSTTSTPSTSQVTEVIKPSSTSKSSLEVLTSFKNIFGKRTRPLTPASTIPLTTAQQRLTNQNAISSFDLRKISRKNKSISNSVVKSSDLQVLDARLLQQKHAAEIQQERLVQQQLRIQLQRQDRELKRLKQMQLQLQEKQENRQKDLLKRHQEKQESLRMEQQKQLEALNQEQKTQLKQLQVQQEQEQQIHLAEIRRRESVSGFGNSNVIVPQDTLIASAPLTPATSRFLAVPAVPEHQQVRDGKSATLLTQGLSALPSTRNEIIPQKNLHSSQEQQLQSPKRPKTQRVVTRIGARRRVNSLKKRQRASGNLERINPVANLPSKILTKLPTTTSSSAVVSGYFTFPSSGLFYNF